MRWERDLRRSALVVRMLTMEGWRSLSRIADLIDGELKRPVPWISASFQRVLLRRRKEKSSHGAVLLAIERWRTWPRERRVASTGRVTMAGWGAGQYYRKDDLRGSERFHLRC